MKKKIFRKTVASIITILVCLSSISVFASEQITLPNSGQVISSVLPNFIAILGYDNDLILNTGGRLTCEGHTQVQYGYIAGLTMELQQYDGQWNTIKTWSASDSTTVSLSKDWYVVSGYQYRLKLTYTAMDSDSTIIESFISYSQTVTYN